jgi:hypothetical protein
VGRFNLFIYSDLEIEKTGGIISGSQCRYWLLSCPEIDVIERFGNPLEMVEWIIEQPFNTKLNKLKKSNAEAFFYWYKIYLLLKT